MKSFAALLLGLLRAPLGAYVLWEFWAWFIVPLGMRPIGLWHAFGLDCCIGLLTVTRYQKTDKEGDELSDWMLTRAVAMWFAYGLTLLIGYFAHRMMAGAA